MWCRLTRSILLEIISYNCRAIYARVMAFEIHVYTWVYSKEDTMAHAHRLVVIS